MKKIVKGELEYFVFESFEKTGLVNHCFSTRKGGVSEGCYSSMNLSFREDKRENVVENYKRLCAAIGSDYRNTVFSDQIHSDEIYDAKPSDRGKGLIEPRELVGKDGLMTDSPGVVLVTFYADCTPLYFLDPVRRVIALSHSGWKGTVLGIGAATVRKMTRDYGCDKKNILAAIGPCIGGCCYQVDSPVTEKFLEKYDFASKHIRPDSSEDGRFLLDLQGMNKDILIEAGIPTENIETADLCTKCNSELLFSHRVMGSRRGSLAALMELRSQTGNV